MATQYDDRPIKPDKEYLQTKQQQNLQKKQQNDFLKKHQFQDKVLPCFRQNFNKKKQKKKQTSEKIKSKAQLYEQIKQKNIQKFGKKGDRITQSQKPQPLKRIDPKKITIQYKPKHAIFIDTNQYKLNKKQEIELNKKQQIEANHESKVNETPNKLQSRIVSSQQSAKQKYEKLLEIMRKQKMELTKDKQNFQQQKQKLEFKRYISAQQTIPFIGQIQKSIKQKRQFEKSHRALCKTSKQNEEQTQAQKRKLRQQLQESPKLKTKNYKNLLQIEHKIRSLQQKKQDIQDQVYKSNMHKYTDQDDVVCTKYSIEQVNQIPGFNVECFKDFIDIKALSPENNQSYQIALKVFETGLSIKQAKIKLKAENIYQHAVQNQNILSSVDFKRRFQGTLRITKYNNGWLEVWNPGVQRVMANKAFFYKVIWLKNGDIKQQWSDKKLGSYFSKEKQVVKISFDKNEPIYFFIKLNQLEQYFNDEKVKEVMFKDGRVQTFSTEDDLMNGFTV